MDNNLRVVEISPDTLMAMRNVLKAYLSRDVYINVQKAFSQSASAKDSTLQVLHVHDHYTTLTEPLEELLLQMAGGKKAMFVLSPQVHMEYTNIFEKTAGREDFGFMDEATFETYINPLLSRLPEIRDVLKNAPSIPKERIFQQGGGGAQEHDDGGLPIPSLANRAYPVKKNFMS